ADAFLSRFEAETREVEETEQRAVAEVEEEVRRAGIVPVLRDFHAREAEQPVVELDRLLHVAADERGMVDAPTTRGGSLGERSDVALAEVRASLGQAGAFVGVRWRHEGQPATKSARREGARCRRRLLRQHDAEEQG